MGFYKVWIGVSNIVNTFSYFTRINSYPFIIYTRITRYNCQKMCFFIKYEDHFNKCNHTISCIHKKYGYCKHDQFSKSMINEQQTLCLMDGI